MLLVQHVDAAAQAKLLLLQLAAHDIARFVDGYLTEGAGVTLDFLFVGNEDAALAMVEIVAGHGEAVTCTVRDRPLHMVGSWRESAIPTFKRWYPT